MKKNPLHIATNIVKDNWKPSINDLEYFERFVTPLS